MTDVTQILSNSGAGPVIDENFLNLMQCPITQAPLRLADEQLISELNQRIAQGAVVNRDGKPVSDQLDSGLVDVNNNWLYPSWNGIPSLLAEDAIALESP